MAGSLGEALFNHTGLPKCRPCLSSAEALQETSQQPLTHYGRLPGAHEPPVPAAAQQAAALGSDLDLGLAIRKPHPAGDLNAVLGHEAG
jgi:hypothetical protein